MLHYPKLMYITLGAFISAVVGAVYSDDVKSTTIMANDQLIEVKRSGGDTVKYLLQKPADSVCSSPSACNFHPLTSPSGLVLTDVAPDDHPHHRGVFLAWLDVKSKNVEGDFWGWGKYAAVENRSIVNRKADTLTAQDDAASFIVHNDWLAGADILLKETLHASFAFRKDVHVHDLIYQLDAPEDVVLGQHAFSGFIVRTRKDAPITVYDPSGVVTLPSPSHLKPETDWPDRRWYAFEMALPSGKKAGVALINHPQNPLTLWHNIDKIGMLNPCIIAPGSVRIPAEQPLKSRYRVVTFDGDIPVSLLDQLAEDFASIQEG